MTKDAKEEMKENDFFFFSIPDNLFKLINSYM